MQAKLLAEESLWYLDTAIINSCRMQDGSSRWEFPYLKSVVGCLVQLAEQQLRAAPHLDDGSIALSEADTGAEIPGTLPAGAAPSISMENPVHTRHCSSLPVVLFLNKYLAARRPVVIQGYQEHCCWGALQSWGSLDFWRGRYGHRLVPVEVQRPGGESGGLRTMKLRDFITEFFLPSVHSQASGESVHGYGPYPRTVQQVTLTSSESHGALQNGGPTLTRCFLPRPGLCYEEPTARSRLSWSLCINPLPILMWLWHAIHHAP